MDFPPVLSFKGRGLTAISTVIVFCSVIPHSPTIPAPGLVLWAWERPEDLRFVNPSTTGVAYLAATVNLQPDGSPLIHFRQQTLRVPSDISLIAVVRIESPPRYVAPNPDRIAGHLAEIAQHPGVKALQIDFDARASELIFYRSLLAELRKRTDLPVGITALASWCERDAWFSSEDIAEAVPMFFRMGRNESKDMLVRASGCSSSIGLSTDESWPAHRWAGLNGRGRIYVFSPHSWTRADYDDVIKKTKEWK